MEREGEEGYATYGQVNIAHMEHIFKIGLSYNWWISS